MMKKKTADAPTIESLDARIVDVRATIATMRDRHSQAVIEDQVFDTGPIREAEEELTAVTAARNKLQLWKDEEAAAEAERLAAMSSREPGRALPKT